MVEKGLSLKRIARIGMMTAIIYACKVALESIPNVELVSFLTIMYAITFGIDAIFAVTVFNLLELVQRGPGTWWISYLYVWPLLAVITIVFKKKLGNEPLYWAILSGVFGLFFGSLFAVLYIPIDVKYAATYFISGLPYDVLHCISNFIIMLILFKPINKLLNRVANMENR